MSVFAGWNFIGCSALLLKNQGVDILLNLYFGPVVNAARGIASTVNRAISSFSGNFMTALNPQITKSYAANDREYVLSLVERGSRFSFFIMFMFALPIFIEADFVLTIWLKQYPEHTVNFVRLILALSLCDIISNTLITLQNATGKIRNYQLAVGLTLLMNFPLSYICLKLSCPPESVLFVAIIVSVFCMILRLLFLRRMVNLSIRRFVYNVCVKIIIVVLASSVLPIVIHSNMDYGWLRLIVVGATSILSSSVMILLLGCTTGERNFIVKKVLTLNARFI
jgi:O-antigen/teichoic acid export membrane protein